MDSMGEKNAVEEGASSKNTALQSCHEAEASEACTNPTSSTETANCDAATRTTTMGDYSLSEENSPAKTPLNAKTISADTEQHDKANNNAAKVTTKEIETRNSEDHGPSHDGNEDEEPGNDQVTVEESQPHKPLEAETKTVHTIPRPATAPAASTAVVTQVVPSVKSQQQPQSSMPSDAAATAGLTPAPASVKAAVESTTSAAETTQTPSGSVPAPAAPAAASVVDAETRLTTTTTATTTTATTMPPPTATMASASMLDPSVQQARAPLTDLYDPFIVETDTSLQDARLRLQTAIDQTRQLREAFTRRVYEKYRVCLQPSPSTQQILTSIQMDPVAAVSRLQAETAQIKEEKEAEKKHAAQLSAANRSSSSALLLHDPQQETTADQLMYYTAGLNLVLLPEQTLDEDVEKLYPDRAPIDHTGQRSRGISVAAATAGQVMLDRARKAAAMRVERQRQKQLSLLTGTSSSNSATADHLSATASLQRSNLMSSLFAAAGKTATTTTKRPKTSTTATKGGGRARGPSASMLSTSTLLSIAPAANEIRNSDVRRSPSAATAALMARSAVHNHKTTQQRLKHPHPESLGGLRRASMNRPSGLAGRSDVATEQQPFLQAYLALTLPPLPGTKERLERKPLPVCSLQAATSQRAAKAVKGVLEQFMKDQKISPITQIRLLYGLRQLGDELKDGKPVTTTMTSSTNADSTTSAVGNSNVQRVLPTPAPAMAGEEPSPDTPLDPVIAFSVLHAVGLVGRRSTADDSKQFVLPDVEQEDCPVWTDKLRSLRARISGNKRTLTEIMLSSEEEDQPGSASPSHGKKGNAGESASLMRSKEESDGEAERSQKKRRTEDTTASAQEALASEAQDEKQADNIDSDIPVESIRGGGEVLLDQTDNTSKSEETTDADRKVEQRPEATSKSSPNSAVSTSKDGPTSGEGSPERRKRTSSSRTRKRKYSDPGLVETSKPSKRKYSDPGRTVVAQQLHASTASNRQVVGQLPEAYGQNSGTLSALHLANQLRSINHPAGELADYMGNLNQQRAIAAGYDIATWPQPASLAAIGLAQPVGAGIVGLAVQDGTAAARAMYAREQQAAALLGSASYPQSAASFPHVTAILAPATSATMLHGAFPVVTAGQIQSSISLPASVQLAGTDNVESKGDGMKPSSSSAGKKVPVSADTAEEGNSVASGQAKEENPGSSAIPNATTLTGQENTSSEDAKQQVDIKRENVPDKGNPTSTSDKSGMKLFEPQLPSTIPPRVADLIKSGRFDESLAGLRESDRFAALEYLSSVGAAVPIPKALVSGPLKERLNTPGFKNTGSGGAPNVPREIVVATVQVWLWAHHEESFQQAFEKSGRIDVDPGCKWLIQAAVDTSVRALTLEIAESMARGEGPFAEASAARKGHGNLKHSSSAQASELDKSAVSKKIELHTATTVSKALMTELSIDGRLNSVIPQFHPLVEYLDEVRLCALRAKSQERAMLASLVARKATMSEPFSHAYTSSMVRAGEALGHGKLFEAVQDAKTASSSMMPYDIFTGDDGAWEDPCRPEEGFTSGLTGDDLMRRAHTNAMMHKSLRKLQDRQHVKGGTPGYGPYVDPPKEESGSVAGGVSPRPSLKRKSSSIIEAAVPSGTGSAPTTSWDVYDPSHFSAPLDWASDHVENTPYGLHRKGVRVRSLSVSLSSRSGEPRSIKKAKRSMSISTAALASVEKTDPEEKTPKSTQEISWADVAGIFQRVELPKKSPPKASGEDGEPPTRTIIAPYCRRLEGEIQIDDDESDTEEDLSEETVLARHQEVLDEMKAKLTAYLEARKRQQERRKSKYNK